MVRSSIPCILYGNGLSSSVGNIWKVHCQVSRAEFTVVGRIVREDASFACQQCHSAADRFCQAGKSLPSQRRQVVHSQPVHPLLELSSQQAVRPLQP